MKKSHRGGEKTNSVHSEHRTVTVRLKICDAAQNSWGPGLHELAHRERNIFLTDFVAALFGWWVHHIEAHTPITKSSDTIFIWQAKIDFNIGAALIRGLSIYWCHEHFTACPPMNTSSTSERTTFRLETFADSAIASCVGAATAPWSDN